MEVKPNKRLCKCCNKTYPFTEEFFTKDKNKRYGLRTQCRNCIKEKNRIRYKENKTDENFIKKVKSLNKYKREWARANPNKERNARLKYVFNITLEEYNIMLQKQEGVCAICEKECITGKNLCVDHNHTSGKIRGLLCDRCNNGLGRFDDDIELLKKAIKYLEFYNE